MTKPVPEPEPNRRKDPSQEDSFQEDGATRTARADEPSLSGFWTGVFDTPDLSHEATPFHAVLVEREGWFSGESIEPNALSPEPTPELFASLEGCREGPDLAFIKIYEDAMGAGHTVRFEGSVDASGTKIVGEWCVVGPGARMGPFVMNRVSQADLDIVGCAVDVRARR